jgi:hypothetical protein
MASIYACTCPLCCPSKPLWGRVTLFHCLDRRRALRHAKRLRRRCGAQILVRRSNPGLDGLWHWAIVVLPEPWTLAVAVTVAA